MNIPRILIAGTQSGVGKTSLTLALIAGLKRRGLKIQTYKVGPDFLDPTYLALASARPCYNLDGWMADRAYVETLFTRTGQSADLAVIEGVMGLFDGADPAGLGGSTAEISQWLQVPVLLVANAHGTARSLAALVSGFAGFEKAVTVKGVIANFCGSAEHRAWLEESLQSAGLPPLLGAVPRQALPELSARHLGLVTADALENMTPQILDRLADGGERLLSLDRILAQARQAPPLDLVYRQQAEPNAPALRLAVARDRAFHFYYQDLFDELKQRGCEILFFSPLADRDLPEAVDGLYLGGGYPEEFAGDLAGNTSLLESIRRFARAGRPVYAECGGLIYLCQSLTTRDNACHRLLGLLPAAARMLGAKKHLGYVEVELMRDSLWGRRGARVRGHEFHYSELLSSPAGRNGWSSVYQPRDRRGRPRAPEGFQQGRLLASYVHLYPACRPQALERFLEICLKDKHHVPKSIAA